MCGGGGTSVLYGMCMESGEQLLGIDFLLPRDLNSGRQACLMYFLPTEPKHFPSALLFYVGFGG